MQFEILSEISDSKHSLQGLASGKSPGCEEFMDVGRWRKRKGIARIRLPDGSTELAELHWYEASGIGRKEFKIKRLL